MCNWHVAENEMSLVCGGRVYVENSIVLYAPTHSDCIWEIETQEDKILVFTLVEGEFEQAVDYFAVSLLWSYTVRNWFLKSSYLFFRCCLLQVYDGLKADDRVLSWKSRAVNYNQVLTKNSPQAIYTTSSSASVRFVKSPMSNLKIRISKVIDNYIT